MYQKIEVIGNLGKDPEMRYTPSGQGVTNFNVATTEKWTGQDGEKHEKTIWFKVNVWGKMAEVCDKYLAKGSKVFIEGKIQEPTIWKGQDGEPHCILEIRAERVIFLNKAGEKVEESPEGMKEDEIPF